MANNVHVALTPRNAAVDAAVGTPRADSGKLRIYDGTQPATADTAVTTQVLLAELTMGATAFGASSGGVATANAITDDSSADNTGTPTWFRLLKSDGTTPILDGSAGTASTDLILALATITAGQPVRVTSMTVTFPA